MEALNFLFTNEISPYKGYIYLAERNLDGFKTIKACRIDHIEYFVAGMQMNSKTDYYITANSLKSARQRSADGVLGLNNVVIDVDIHEEIAQYDRNKLIDEFIFRFKRDLDIPMPNLIHRTGRGVHLWWHLEQAAAVIGFMYKRIVDKLILAIRGLLREYPELQKNLDIDTSASSNLCGYFRLFGTYNTNTHTRTTWELLHTNTYDINTLFKQLEADETVQEQQRQEEIDRKKYCTNKNLMFFDCSYVALQKKRIELLQWLVKARRADITGQRDIVLFLYYNCCIQLYNPSDSKKKTQALNDSFAEPLEKIEYIFKLFDNRKNYYKFKSSTFSEWLDITELEQAEFDKQHITHNAARTHQREVNKTDKNKRKQLATDMIRSGKYTYSDVVEATKFSIATVKRIAATVDKPASEAQQKPWEELGISRITYYRRKKEGK